MKRSIMIHLLLIYCAMMPSLSLSSELKSLHVVPPIVYTIAGSDSGGGAGIQADLHAIHNMKCHGCSAITCLTAQNSVGVTAVHAPPPSFLREQLDTLLLDLPPRSIKIGMLGTRKLAEEVGSFLCRMKKETKEKVWVVLDPVMISTSGHRLIEEDAQAAMIEHIFPHSDLLTPNLYEAEALLGGRKIETAQDVEQAARDLLKLGVPAVLMKGGHIATDGTNGANQGQQYAQDYILSSLPSDDSEVAAEPRLCDASRGVWLRSAWFDSENTHGTGCTLSSATAAALALGEQERTNPTPVGSKSSIQLVDACCLAKAYVAEGIRMGVRLGQGEGPVGQTYFPSSYESFTSIVQQPNALVKSFRRMKPFGAARTSVDDDCPELGRILPIIDSVDWIRKVCQLDGITDVQLRVKGELSKERVAEIVKESQSLCERAGIRLWVNDHFEAAVAAKCFGVHVGQEDLVRCLDQGGMSLLRENNIALGISTHSYGELAVALGLRPTYISLGPVFATVSKKVGFDPQGLETVAKWRQLVPPDIPVVAIGGIGTVEEAAVVRAAGADCIAVIGAVTKASDIQASVAALNAAMIL